MPPRNEGLAENGKFLAERTVKASLQGEGVRLDNYLKVIASVTRQQARKMIDWGYVTVNGQVQKKYHRIIRDSDDVSYKYYKKIPVEITPFEKKLEIIYQGPGFIAVNKPAGMIVHPTGYRETDTLVNAVKAMYPENTIHAINRLDRDTTGIVLVALNSKTAAALVKLMMKRKIHKEYLCLVHGRLEKKGEITAEIARNGEGRAIRNVVESGGLTAHTIYEPLKINENSTILKVILKTGRTHQIRSHMKHIGHPVVGDKTYGDRALDIKLLGEANLPAGQLLHAYKMEFENIETKKNIIIVCEPVLGNIFK